MIVVTTFKTEDKVSGKPVFTDKWQKFDDYAQAKEIYVKHLDRDELFSASIVEVIESTDYNSGLVQAKIDYELLREQKEMLLLLNEQFDADSDFGKALAGVTILIDNIQDQAVKFGWATEEEAFDLDFE